jgi:hypothetical protein
MNLKKILLFGFVILIAILGISIFIPVFTTTPDNTTDQSWYSNEPNMVHRNVTPKTAVDTKVDEIINSLSTEQTIINKDDEDATIIKSDSSVINNLSEVYNEQEL